MNVVQMNLVHSAAVNRLMMAMTLTISRQYNLNCTIYP